METECGSLQPCPKASLGVFIVVVMTSSVSAVLTTIREGREWLPACPMYIDRYDGGPQKNANVCGQGQLGCCIEALGSLGGNFACRREPMSPNAGEKMKECQYAIVGPPSVNRTLSKTRCRSYTRQLHHDPEAAQPGEDPVAINIFACIVSASFGTKNIRIAGVYRSRHPMECKYDLKLLTGVPLIYIAPAI